MFDIVIIAHRGVAMVWWQAGRQCEGLVRFFVIIIRICVNLTHGIESIEWKALGRARRHGNVYSAGAIEGA